MPVLHPGGPLGSNINNFSALALFHHLSGHRLQGEKQTFNVNGKYLVETLRGDFEHGPILK